MRDYRRGGARIAYRAGWTEIALNSGAELSTPWTEKPGDAEIAARIGCESAEAMNRDHDVLHGGPADPLWRFEEAAVMALHAWLAARGETAEDVLKRKDAGC